MKKILLFAGYRYYPKGGWEDFKGDFDTYQEALIEGEELLNDGLGKDWYHVVDTENGNILNSNT